MVETRIENNIYIACIESNFTVDDVEDIVEEAESKEAHSVLLDMKNVDYISSSMIGMLSIMAKSLHGMQMNLGVAGLNKGDQDLLKVTALDQIMSVFDNVSSGIALFSKS